MNSLTALCEYERAPIGIDVIPRFSWLFPESCKGKRQVQYQIQVRRSDDRQFMWDSGLQESSDCLNISYEGCDLCSNTLYTYTVRCVTDLGEELSDTSTFRTGILKENEWKAQWIRPMLDLYSGRLFREWRPGKPIKTAVAYVAGLGFYELYINGNKVGDALMNNAHTDYSKTVLYDCFDVTEMLENGENCLAIQLGQGWANRLMSDYGIAVDELAALLQLEIEYQDGDRETVITEPHKWKSTSNGAYLYNSLYKGVIIDMNQEAEGWNLPGYSEAHPDMVFPVELMEGPAGKLIHQDLEHERIVETIKPRKMDSQKEGHLLFDFGVNHSGYPIIHFHEQQGTRIEITFSEVLTKEGELDPLSYAWNAPKDVYVCTGKDDVFVPKFTCHAYRYMAIDGACGKLDVGDIDGCVIHNDVPKKGFFECGNEIVNQMQEVMERTETNNLHAVPTDCPHRERAGWLNDVSARAEQGIYNYDLTRLYAKWMRDVRDAQGKRTGTITDVAPYLHGPKNATTESSSYVIIPWLVYLHSGDKRILQSNYAGLKRWQGYLTSISEESHIPWAHYGDWCQPAAYTIKDNWQICARSAITPAELIADAYYYNNAAILSKVAAILGETQDAAMYTDQAQTIKKAFNDKWLDPKTGNYGGGSQAGNAIALWAGLVPPEIQQTTAKNLAEDVAEKGYHLSTGSQCTKYLIEMLLKYHYEETAYRVLTQTTYPSWGYMFKNGATSYWERWEYLDENQKGMMSYDHPMQGSACSAFHKYLAGISPCEEAPGFAKVRIRPVPIEALKYVNSKQITKHGTITCDWKFTEDQKYVQENHIPFNTSAEIYVPLAAGDKVYFNQTMLMKDKVLLQDSVDGCRILGLEDNYLRIFVPAGEYQFVVE